MNNQKSTYNEEISAYSFDKMGSVSEDLEMILCNLNEINENQHYIIDRISGSGIGKIQETATLLELKSSFPNDHFSDENADKHGTDIIATVLERGEEISQITISVKHQKKWSSEFLTQLESNMSQDGTDWGFLVTTTFPSEALNKRIWTMQGNHNRLILLVKPEFASIAYYAIRMIIVYELRLSEMVTEGLRRHESTFQFVKKEVDVNNNIRKEEKEND